MALLSIRNLALSFRHRGTLAPVLKGISLNIAAGERVALVGESGSGKSVTARLILGLLQRSPAVQVAGEILFEGTDINQLSEQGRARLRGTEIAMIFQDPTSSLNPAFPILTQFQDVLRRRRPKLSAAEAHQTACALLDDVAIRNPERVLQAYSFQLSGGMNQRIMIAMALANKPALLIADEPGTALDVTVQAQTLQLMRDLVIEHQTAVLFISHNLGVVREFADWINVIYRGQLTEQGPTQSVFGAPRHPYTRALLQAVPRITGGGLPSLPDNPADFLAKTEIHEDVL